MHHPVDSFSPLLPAFAKLRLWIALGFILFLSGCATFAPNPPQDQSNICEIFREQPSWYDYAQESRAEVGYADRHTDVFYSAGVLVSQPHPS